MLGYPNYTYSSYPYAPNYNSNVQQQVQNNINWVSGEAAAKSVYVPAGQSVLLMDSESNVFYIKSADISGMPLPLRIFDYTERIPPSKNEQISQSADFVTREEFEKRLAELKDAKQYIQTV